MLYIQFEVRDLSTVCALVPVALLCLLAIVPESPVFRLAKGNIVEARRSLRFYRGPRCDLDEELDEMMKSLVKVRARAHYRNEFKFSSKYLRICDVSIHSSDFQTV